MGISIDVDIGKRLKERKELKELESSRPGKMAALTQILPNLGLRPDDVKGLLTPSSIDQFSAEDIIGLASDVTTMKMKEAKQESVAGSFQFNPSTGGFDYIKSPGMVPGVDTAPKAMPQPGDVNIGLPSASLAPGVGQPGEMAGQVPYVPQKVAEQVLAKRHKDILQTKQDVARAEMMIGTTFDKWLDTILWSYTEYGIKPGGPIGGIANKMLGATRKNPNWESFKGSLLEYGAGIARIAMPGIRAARAIKMFQDTAPTDWSTIESGFNNTAASLRSAVSKDIAAYEEDYYDVLGKDFPTLNLSEKHFRAKEFLRGMEDQFKEGMYRQLYKALSKPEVLKEKPDALDLVPKKWRDKIEGDITTLGDLGFDPDKYEIVR